MQVSALTMRSAMRWPWIIPVIAVSGYIVIGVEGESPPPVPFLLLLASVVLAGAGGGRTVGAMAGLAATAVIAYSTSVDFGPPTLTGNYRSAAFGSAISIGLGVWLGSARDQNVRLLASLRDGRAELERLVDARTAELQRANDNLLRSIDARDVSERAMRHTLRMESLGRMAGGVAHDFNNLLMSILANAEVGRRSPLPTGLDDHLHAIETAAQRASELCTQMLAFTGHERTSPEVVDVGQLVRDTTSLMLSSTSPSVDITCRCDSEQLVLGDRAQLGQVVLNVLTNARESIEGSGLVNTVVRRVDVAAAELGRYRPNDGHQQPGAYVCIEVTDDGAGMSSEQIDTMFDPFFSSKGLGRGLGLSVVFGVLRTHRGLVHIDSEVGRGTTFQVLLPAAPASLAPTTRTDAPEVAVVSDLSGEIDGEVAGDLNVAGVVDVADAARPADVVSRVLVADDQEAVRSVVATMLRQAGYTVSEAADGAEAVAMLDPTHQFDMVLLDAEMPILTGYEVLEHLRSTQPTIPVIIMSGYHEHPDEPIPNAYLTKPFRAADLQRCIERCR